MEKCYEYLGCEENECIMKSQDDDRQCWEVKDTLSNTHAIALSKHKCTSKEEACSKVGCLYYIYIQDYSER